MIKLYICEICGNQSTNRAEIEKCEAQGKNPSFTRGQKAILGYTEHSVGKKVPVEIGHVIKYHKRDHIPWYNVSYPPEFQELQRIIDVIPQDRLQPVPSAS